MAAYLHVQAVLPGASGLPEDVFVNTFNFRQLGPATVPGAVGEVSQAVAAFYNNPSGLNNPLSSVISSEVVRTAGACQIRIYDITGKLDGSPMGSPFFTDTFTLGAAGAGGDLPSEVALVGTMLGAGRELAPVEVGDNVGSDPDDPDLQRDRPMQRRTGRIYLGPLKLSAANATNGRTPSTDLVSDLPEAIVRLHTTALALTTSTELCVWSRKNAAMYDVFGAFADNAFDTQRRRGKAPTARSIFYVP